MSDTDTKDIKVIRIEEPTTHLIKSSFVPVVGTKGEKGDTGDTGPIGPSGSQGPQGVQGPQGEQGPSGSIGPIGPSGSQGIQGIQGPSGSQGPQGIQGPSGSQGPQGIQGPEGPQGPIGPSGSQGPQGTTNYNDLTNVPVGIVSSSTQLPLVASASFAISASYAPGISSVDWSNITGAPSGLVSSSAQMPHVDSASLADKVEWVNVSNRPTGIVSSSTQAITWTVASSSVATSASWAPGITSVEWDSINGKPTGIVSSSTQIPLVNSASLALGVEFDNVLNKPTLVSSSVQAQSWTVATSSVATFATVANSASYANSTQWTGITHIPVGLVSSSQQIPLVSASISASYALSASWAPGITSVEWDIINNKPVGIVSSSTQAANWTVLSASYAQTDWSQVHNRPSGIVSGNAQITTWTVATASLANAVQFTNVLNKPTLVSSSAQISNVDSASLAGAVQFTNVLNKPSGLVSSSAQIVSVSFADTTTWNGVNNKPSGIVSSSTQAVTWTVATASLANAVEFTNVTNKPTLVSSSAQIPLVDSASLANAVQFNNVLNKPTGLVSSSAQATTWTVLSASYAQTDWSEVHNRPSGIVSSSAQATTWTVATASLANAVTWNNVNGKPNGIVSSSTQAATWTVATSSVATSASYAPLPSIISASAFSGSQIHLHTNGAEAGVKLQVANSDTAKGGVRLFANTPSGTSGDTVVSLETITTSGVRNGEIVNVNLQPVPTASWSGIHKFGTMAFSSGGVDRVIISQSAGLGSVSASLFIGSASFANTTWNSVNNKPSGIVSSSTQATSWTVATASVALNVPNVSVTYAPISGTNNRNYWWLPNYNGAGFTTRTPMSDKIEFYPFIAPNVGNSTLKVVGMDYSSANTISPSTMSLAIYSNRTGDMYPDTLVLDTSVRLQTGSAGTITASLGTPVQLAGGELYWIAINGNGQGVCRALNTAALTVIGHSSSLTSAGGIVAYSSASTFGSSFTYPNTINTDLTEEVNVTMPKIGFRFGI